MKKFTCILCQETKDEIEFEYLWLRKKYKRICKQCEENKQDVDDDNWVWSVD